MKFLADLHLHSKYSRACSSQLTIPNIAQWAKLKGIKVVGTSDFTHPFWFSDIKKELEEAEPGLYRLKGQTDDQTRFILSCEIASIYSQGGKGRRIHNVILAPNIATVEKINAALSLRGNLMSDGRPILGLSAQDLASLVLEIEPSCLVIPAHAWTPWFSLYGSNSGFDSIEECFGDLTKYIYAIETGLSCYDQETEILAEVGWKPVSKVTYSDKICTLNLETEIIEYQPAQRIYQYKYKGKMYRLKTKRADLLVTPNHNLLYAPADFRIRKPFKLKEARELFRKSKILRKDGIWKGQMSHSFVLPMVKMRHGSKWYSGFRTKVAKKLPIVPWVKFFGYWIAEGWTSKGKSGDYNVCIAVQEPGAKEEIIKIFKELDYAPYHDKKIVRVRNYQLFSYLRQFGKAGTKFVPLEIKSLSKHLLEVFLEYYLRGDGHIYGRNSKGRSATTISTQLRDDLQEIALKIGISAYYKLHKKKGALFSSPSQKKEYRQSANSWVVYFIRRNRHAIIPSEMKKHKHKERWVDYDGMVYCVSAPNRVVYIRRNGIPLWCGNSDPAMNWRLKELDNRAILSFSDAHSLPKLGREMVLFETNLSYEGIACAIKTGQGLLGTIEFYPEEGKYHYTGHRLCQVRHSPEETAKLGTICPVCGKKLTIGVMHRVEELATRQIEELQIKNENGWVKSEILGKPSYKMLVPLQEILAEALAMGVGTGAVEQEYSKLVDTFGSEINVLVKASKEDLEKVTKPRVADGILKVRAGDLIIEPGYDGVFGIVKIWSSKVLASADEPEEKNSDQTDQMRLF